MRGQRSHEQPDNDEPDRQGKEGHGCHCDTPVWAVDKRDARPWESLLGNSHPVQRDFTGVHELFTWVPVAPSAGTLHLVRHARFATWSLALLAVLAVLLAVVALQTRDREPTAGSNRLDVPAAATPPPLPSSALARATPRPVPDRQPVMATWARSGALRAVPAGCLGRTLLWRTLDGGRTWVRLDVPATPVVAVQATSGRSYRVTGAVRGCRLSSFESANGGQTWVATDTLAANWFVTPGADVHTDAGLVISPCSRRAATLAAEATSFGGAVLCSDGMVFVSGNAGLTYASTVPGAVALAARSDDSTMWLLRRDAGRCPAYVIQRSVDSGATWSRGGCVGDASLLANATAPTMAFWSATKGLVAVGATSLVSEDGGFTWAPPARRSSG